MTKAATDSHKQRPREPSIALYFLLAALTLAMIGGGLWLLHSMENDYRTALEESNEWHEFLDDASVLEEALEEMRAPAWRTFDRNGVAARAFGEKVSRVRTLSARIIDGLTFEERSEERTDVVRAIPAIRQSLREMQKAVDQASDYARRPPNSAVSALNAEMHIATTKLHRVRSGMRDVQSAYWGNHARSLEGLRRAELVLVGALTAAVIFLALFGRVLHLRFARDATALEQARLAQKAEAVRFKAFAEVASDWVWETDAKHRFSYLSDSVSRFIDPAAWLGRICYAGIVKAPRHGANAADVAALLEKREAFDNLLLELHTPDGSVAWVVSDAVPRFDDAGAFLGYRGSSRDVTETIQAQDALRKSEVLYRSLADSIDGIVSRIRLGEVWTIEYVSPKNEEMFGIAPAQVIGLNVKDVWRFGLHRDDLERYRGVVESAVAARGAFEIEYRVKAPSGDYRWVLERGHVVPGEPGEPDLLDGIMIDITARKEAEFKVAEAENRIRTLIETIDEVFYTCIADENWTAVFLSPAFERLTGYPVDDVVSNRTMSLGDLVHPDDRDHVKAVGEAAKGNTFEMTYRIVTKSGDVRWIFERGRRSGETASGKVVVSGFMTDITEMKRLEAEVNERNQYLETLARNLDGSIYRGRISPSEMISCFGKRPPTFAMMNKDDLNRYVHQVADACRQMRPYEIEYRITGADGQERWMVERGVPAEPNAHGIAQFVDGLVLDVTQQRRLRDELEVREKLISALASNLQGAMFRIRLGEDELVEFVSSGIKKILGVDAETLAGRKPELSSFMHPDDIAPRTRIVAAAAREHRSYESKHRVILPDGAVRWILERGAIAEYNVDGSPAILDGVVFDVTEQHRLNEELAERERRFATLAANIDGIMFRARNGALPIMEYYSPGIEKLVGIPAADLIGKPSIGMRLTHADDIDNYTATVKAALRARRSYEVEFRMVLPSGATRWVLERGQATEFDDQGKPTIIEGFSLDITERKEVEVALAAARDAAEAASKAKSEFLAMMSHEIRTPMNGVLGMTGVLLDSGLTPEQRHSATTIRESAESLLRIINDVLDFSKLEAGALRIETAPFNLHSLLAYAGEIAAPRADAKSVALHVDIEPRVPTLVRADAGRIRQVVLNLLGNAVKFTERGSVRLEARARKAPDGRHSMHVRVVDTGIGIASDRLAHLFQSFEQADASISRRFGGTGLGLAISKKLVERMGGRIGVESESGKGSVFWFELPVELASEDEVEQSLLTAPAPNFEAAVGVLKALGRAPRVLVVEDNATNQLVAKSVLANFGITADVAGNGIEAIEAVRHAPYDVVLMDVHMPEMDGLEATRAIRAMQGPMASIPIVALTANAFAEDIERCREAGMSAHIGKPFRKEELIVALAEAVQGRSHFYTTSFDNDAAGDHAPTLDWQTIENFRADSGEEMLHVLIDTFLCDTAAKLDQLVRIAQSGAVGPEAMRLAHSLKSASAMAGAIALSRYCGTVEAKLSPAGRASEADARAMQQLFASYREALKERGLIAA